MSLELLVGWAQDLPHKWIALLGKSSTAICINWQVFAQVLRSTSTPKEVEVWFSAVFHKCSAGDFHWVPWTLASLHISIKEMSQLSDTIFSFIYTLLSVNNELLKWLTDCTVFFIEINCVTFKTYLIWITLEHIAPVELYCKKYTFLLCL